MYKTMIALLFLSSCAWAQNPVSDALRTDLAGAAKKTIAAA